MSKVTVFYLNSSKFFVDLFFRDAHIFPLHLTQIKSPCLLFDFLDLIADFLDFLNLKTVF